MLTKVRMRAMRPLSGDDYGKVDEGQEFTTDSKKAERLEAKGLACRIEGREFAVSENKMMPSPENKSHVGVVPRLPVHVRTRR